MVDLEAAFTGEQRNLDLIKKLVSSLNIPVEVGGHSVVQSGGNPFGGRRGSGRIGTKAVEDPKFLSYWRPGLGGDAIAVGVDAKEGKVAVKGWWIYIDALQFIDQICQGRVGTIIFTDIATDGMLSGPSFSAQAALLRLTEVVAVQDAGDTGFQIDGDNPVAGISGSGQVGRVDDGQNRCEIGARTPASKYSQRCMPAMFAFAASM